MATVVSSNISDIGSIPALVVPYSVNIAETTASAQDGKFREYKPHTSQPFTKLASRARACEHSVLGILFSLSAKDAFTGLQIVGAWFPEDIGEPASMSDILDHPDAEMLTLRAGCTVRFACRFDRFISRSVNYDPEVGGRPTFFVCFVWFNESPFVSLPDGTVVQPAPDAKARSLRISYVGEVKISALTSHIFL